MEEHHAAWLSIIMNVVFFVGLILSANQRDNLKQEAVDKGFAEWHIISGTKETEFKWKETK